MCVLAATEPRRALASVTNAFGIAERHCFFPCELLRARAHQEHVLAAFEHAPRELDGIAHRLTAAIAPALSVEPSMRIASSSGAPSRFRCEPIPASKMGLSSRVTIAASTASIADPPRDRMFHPAASAARHPSRHAATASSGMSHAPPCTIKDGRDAFTGLFKEILPDARCSPAGGSFVNRLDLYDFKFSGARGRLHLHFLAHFLAQ